MFILPDALVKEMILAIEADTTIFPAGMKLHLFTNDFTPTRTNVLADFTQLTNVEVPGYVVTLPAWAGAPLRTQTGSWEDQQVSPATFAATGPPPSPQIVYGWYLTDGAVASVVGSGRFDVPFTFVQTGDGFRLEGVIRIIQTNGTDYTVTLDYEME